MQKALTVSVVVLALLGLGLHLAIAKPAAGPRARLVAGTHFAIGVRHPLPPAGVSASTSLADFTLAGDLDFSNLFDNDNGVVSGPGVDTGSTYVVTAQRVLEVVTASGEGALGGVSKGGDVVAGAVISNGADPSMAVFAKRAGAHADASLLGEYFVAAFLHDPGAVVNRGVTGIVDFDGAGAYDLTTIDNDDGVISGPNADVGTYAVAADGALTLNDAMGDPLEGGLVRTDDFGVVAGFTVGGKPPVAALLLKKSGRYSNRSFRGTYFLAVFLYGVSGGTYRTASGELVADGAGSFTIETFDNDAGVASGPNVDAGTYSVAPDGTLTVFTSGGDTLLGGLGRRGRLGIVGGGISAGSDPLLAIVIKKR